MPQEGPYKPEYEAPFSAFSSSSLTLRSATATTDTRSSIPFHFLPLPFFFRSFISRFLRFYNLSFVKTPSTGILPPLAFQPPHTLLPSHLKMRKSSMLFVARSPCNMHVPQRFPKSFRPSSTFESGRDRGPRLWVNRSCEVSSNRMNRILDNPQAELDASLIPACEASIRAVQSFMIAQRFHRRRRVNGELSKIVFSLEKGIVASRATNEDRACRAIPWPAERDSAISVRSRSDSIRS